MRQSSNGTGAGIAAAGSGAPQWSAWLLRTIGNGCIAAVGIAVALLLWYGASWTIGDYFPTPPTVFDNAVANLFASQYLRGLGLPEGGYAPHLLYTTTTVIIGVGVGVAVGTATGLLASRWRVVEQIVDPITTIFGTVPIVVAAPFFLIWFGLVAMSQIILVLFYTAIIMHLFVLRAVRNIDAKYLEYATTLGASPRTSFARVVLPGAIPEIFGGIRVCFAAAWSLAAIGELLGANFGVGRVIVSLSAVYDVTGMMALIVLLGIIAMAIDGLIVAARAYLTRWAATASQS